MNWYSVYAISYRGPVSLICSAKAKNRIMIFLTLVSYRPAVGEKEIIFSIWRPVCWMLIVSNQGGLAREWAQPLPPPPIWEAQTDRLQAFSHAVCLSNKESSYRLSCWRGKGPEKIVPTEIMLTVYAPSRRLTYLPLWPLHSLCIQRSWWCETAFGR